MSSMPPIIDSHLHLWDPTALDYPWLATTPELQRPYLPRDLDTGGREVPSVVVIEADCSPAQRLQEVEWIRTQQDHGTHIAGIVASVTLDTGDDLARQLEALQRDPLVKGVRHNFQQERQDFITAPATLTGARRTAGAGFTFDACIRHDQLPALTAFACEVPELPIVLDHLGKPPISSGDIATWRTHLQQFAALPNTYVKLSGAAPEADPAQDLAGQALPYLETALELFGTGRCMFGSDWPVSPAARPPQPPGSPYREWADIVLDQAMNGATDSETTAVAHATAAGFYRLTDQRRVPR